MLFSGKDLTKLLIPLMIEQLLAVAVGMADVVMVAAVGEAAVSGVSLVDSISLLINQMLAALATGGAVVISQYLGNKKLGKACHASGQLMFVTMVVSCIIAAVALVFNRSLLGLIFGRVEADVMENAVTYFAITACSYPFLALYNSGAAVYRSVGNSKVSMYVSLVMNAINVAGNYTCVYILHWGVEGVAYPTLVSRMAAAVIMITLIRGKQNQVRVRKLRDLYPSPRMIRNILSVGIPSGLENSIFQVGKLTLQSLVSSLGTTALASYAVASNLVTLQYLATNAIGLGMITVVGRCVGAREYGQARHYARRLLLLNYGFSAVVCAVMVLGAGAIVGIYQLSPEAAAEAQRMITVHSFFMILHPISFTLPNALRASYDAKFTMVVSIFSMWMFRVLLAYWFVRTMNLGIMGVWYGMYVDWAFRALMFEMRFRGYEKRMGRIGAHEAFSS